MSSAELLNVLVVTDRPTYASNTGGAAAATGFFTDGTHADLTSLVQWSSNAPGVMSVSNASGNWGRLGALGAGRRPAPGQLPEAGGRRRGRGELGDAGRPVHLPGPSAGQRGHPAPARGHRAVLRRHGAVDDPLGPVEPGHRVGRLLRTGHPGVAHPALRRNGNHPGGGGQRPGPPRSWRWATAVPVQLEIDPAWPDPLARRHHRPAHGLGHRLGGRGRSRLRSSGTARTRRSTSPPPERWRPPTPGWACCSRSRAPLDATGGVEVTAVGQRLAPDLAPRQPPCRWGPRADWRWSAPTTTARSRTSAPPRAGARHLPTPGLPVTAEARRGHRRAGRDGADAPAGHRRGPGRAPRPAYAASVVTAPAGLPTCAGGRPRRGGAVLGGADASRGDRPLGRRHGERRHRRGELDLRRAAARGRRQRSGRGHGAGAGRRGGAHPGHLPGRDCRGPAHARARGGDRWRPGLRCRRVALGTAAPLSAALLSPSGDSSDVTADVTWVSSAPRTAFVTNAPDAARRWWAGARGPRRCLGRIDGWMAPGLGAGHPGDALRAWSVVAPPALLRWWPAAFQALGQLRRR